MNRKTQPDFDMYTLLRIGRSMFVAAFAILLPLSAVQADEWEWDPTWGYHEEEWYDPSDWFSTDETIDYEDYQNDYYGNYYDDYGDDYDTELYEEGYENNEFNDEYIGNDYFSNDWYDEEPDFDNWYDYDYE